jgi:hypothetical protein
VKALLVLSLLALAMSTAAVPGEWVVPLPPGFNRAEWVFGCFAVCLLGPIITSRDPRWTIVGGFICFGLAAAVANHAEASLHWAAQSALAFVIAHSLRWRDGEIVGTGGTRVLIGLVWIAQSALWSQSSGSEALIGCSIFGGAVLASYGLHRWATGNWATRVVPISAAVVFLSAPGTQFAGRLKHTEPGYLAVAGSFVLFGLGTIAAFTRKRWSKSETH